MLEIGREDAMGAPEECNGRGVRVRPRKWPGQSRSALPGVHGFDRRPNVYDPISSSKSMTRGCQSMAVSSSTFGKDSNYVAEECATESGIAGLFCGRLFEFERSSDGGIAAGRDSGAWNQTRRTRRSDCL